MEKNDYFEFWVNFFSQEKVPSLYGTTLIICNLGDGLVRSNVLGAPGVHLFRSGLSCILLYNLHRRTYNFFY